MILPWRHCHWIAIGWVLADCLLGFSHNWVDATGQDKHRYWFDIVVISVLGGWSLTMLWRFDMRVHLPAVAMVLCLAATGHAWVTGPDWAARVHVDIAVLLRLWGVWAFLWALWVMARYRHVLYDLQAATVVTALAFGAALMSFGILETQLCNLIDPAPRAGGSVCSRALGVPWDNYVFAGVVSFLGLLAINRFRRTR